MILANLFGWVLVSFGTRNGFPSKTYGFFYEHREHFYIRPDPKGTLNLIAAKCLH